MDLEIFSLKPSRDQGEDNDIRYSPIGSAVLEVNQHIQTKILLFCIIGLFNGQALIHFEVNRESGLCLVWFGTLLPNQIFQTKYQRVA